MSAHGRQVGNGVEQALALGGRAARDVEVDHVGAQALGGDLEGGAGAGAVLEEQVEHALAAQQRHLLDLAVVDADRKVPAVSRMCVRMSRGRPSMDSRWISSPFLLSWGLRL
jgi:hypothetical protein